MVQTDHLTWQKGTTMYNWYKSVNVLSLTAQEAAHTEIKNALWINNRGMPQMNKAVLAIWKPARALTIFQTRATPSAWVPSQDYWQSTFKTSYIDQSAVQLTWMEDLGGVVGKCCALFFLFGLSTSFFSQINVNLSHILLNFTVC